MKKRIDRNWNRFFDFVSDFFGTEQIKAILSGDDKYFSTFPQDNDDNDDNLWFITEDLAFEIEPTESFDCRPIFLRGKTA